MSRREHIICHAHEGWHAKESTQRLELDTGRLDYLRPSLDALLQELLHGLRTHDHRFRGIGGETFP